MVVGNDVDDHVTKLQITLNEKPKVTVTKDIRRKCTSTKSRHKLQQSDQTVNETGLTNTPIPTKVLSRKRQRDQKTIDTNGSLQPSKKRLRLVMVNITYIHENYVLANLQDINGKKYHWKCMQLSSVTDLSFILVLFTCYPRGTETNQ